MPTTKQLFDRRVKVILASTVAQDYATMTATTVEIEKLRVMFSVKKSLKRSANCAEVSIVNLSERTRASLQSKGAKLIIQAGYANTIGQIFKGDTRFIDHVREGAEWITKVESGDGERGLTHARISESFKGGVKLPDIAVAIGKKLGFDANDITKKLGKVSKQFVNGYTVNGPASKELDKVLAAAGYEFSVQDGKIQVLEKGGVNTERVVVLSSASGLVGSPEHGTSSKKGKSPVLKVKSLLMPDIRPGGRVQLDSISHKGLYRALRVEHKGDTSGGDWYTESELEVAK